MPFEFQEQLLQFLQQFESYLKVHQKTFLQIKAQKQNQPKQQSNSQKQQSYYTSKKCKKKRDYQCWQSLMRRSRLERPRLTPQAPQACVSTNSTTPAECLQNISNFTFCVKRKHLHLQNIF